MKDMKVLSRNDLYLVTRLAKAANDLAERCGVNGTPKRRVVRRAKRAVKKAVVAPVTRPVPRPPVTRRPVTEDDL